MSLVGTRGRLKRLHPCHVKKHGRVLVKGTHLHAIGLQTRGHPSPCLRQNPGIRQGHFHGCVVAIRPRNGMAPRLARVVLQAGSFRHCAPLPSRNVPGEGNAVDVFRHGPAHRQGGRLSQPFTFCVPDRLDFCTMGVQPLRKCRQKGMRRGHAVHKRLQHVRLRGEPERAKQGGVACAVPRGFQKSEDARLRGLSHGIHVRHHGPALVLHPIKKRGLHLVPQKRSHHRSSLVGLGGDQGHGVGVVCTVGGVRVHEYVRLDRMVHAHKSLRVAAVHLHEIAVQVQVGGVAPEPILLGTVLVRARAAVSARRSANVVLGDNDPVGTGQRVLRRMRYRKPLGSQCQARVHPARFARVNGVVYEDGDAVFSLGFQAAAHPFGIWGGVVVRWIAREDQRVDGPSHVAHTDHVQGRTRIGSRQPFCHRHRFLPGGGSVGGQQAVGRPRKRGDIRGMRRIAGGPPERSQHPNGHPCLCVVHHRCK